VNGLIAFWSYGLAACLFASVMAWRLRERVDGPEKLLVAGYLATAAWATLSAIRGPVDPVHGREAGPELPGDREDVLGERALVRREEPLVVCQRRRSGST